VNLANSDSEAQQFAVGKSWIWLNMSNLLLTKFYQFPLWFKQPIVEFPGDWMLGLAWTIVLDALCVSFWMFICDGFGNEHQSNMLSWVCRECVGHFNWRCQTCVWGTHQTCCLAWHSKCIGTQAIDDDWWYLMMGYDHQISWMGRTKHLNRIAPANYFDEPLLLAYTVSCCNQPLIYFPILKGGKLQRLHVWIRNTSVFDLVHMFMTSLSFLHIPTDNFTATQRKTV